MVNMSDLKQDIEFLRITQLADEAYAIFLMNSGNIDTESLKSAYIVAYRDGYNGAVSDFRAEMHKH